MVQENTKTLNEEKLLQLRETLSEIDLEISDFSLVQDNKRLFCDNQYRATMPSQKQFSEANEKKNACYVRLIQTKGCVTKNKLKKLLKENQEIDVYELEDQKKEIQSKLESYYFALYETKDNEAIVKLKLEISEIKNDFLRISTEIVGLLSPSIEDQVEKEYIEYLAYLCTEKLVDSKDEKWEQHWKDYNSFQNDNSKILNQAIANITYLLMNTEDH